MEGGLDGRPIHRREARGTDLHVQALCERDGGRLWGVSLCGPMVIADMRTQTFATSQPAPEGARPRLVGLMNAPSFALPDSSASDSGRNGSPSCAGGLSTARCS